MIAVHPYGLYIAVGLFQGEDRLRQIEALDRASLRLGVSGAAERTAAIVEEMIGTASA